MDPEGIQHVDTEWYARFQEVGAFQAYEYLRGGAADRDAEKAAFLSKGEGNPTLRCPDIDLARTEDRENQLLQLKKDIRSQEKDPVTKQAYLWRINEKIAELRLLQAARDGDMRRFKVWNRFVYGEPSPEIFAYTIQNIASEAAELTSSDVPEVQKAAMDLLSVLPTMDAPTSYDLPDEETFRVAQEVTQKEFGHLIARINENREYEAEEMRALFEEALKAIEADGWAAITDPKRKKLFNVSQELKQVQSPMNGKHRDAIVRLIMHEIATHVARRVNGERSKLKLLGLGLDRYEGGEEGVAKMREQVTEGEVTDFAGLAGHLAVGLAIGVDGKPRDFRDVYTILEKYYLLNKLKKGGSYEEALSQAQTSAWNKSVTIFKGTDCATPGVCFTKDMIYREGNIGVWELVGKNPDELMRLSVGKYDPTNPRHIWILTQLGITDEDLDSVDRV